MTLIILSVIVFVLAAFPVGVYFANLPRFRISPSAPETCGASCSILIPARNEERGIRDCVEAALGNRGITLEVIVLDDGSSDGTAHIVREISAQDPRVRVVPAPPLPSGWCGKQHACHVLAELAAHEHLLFIDADLNLSSDAAARAIQFLQVSGAALASAFPRQRTGSLFERLLIPMIHVILLGYLPLKQSRRKCEPAMAAGCGQFFLTRRAGYTRAGGHAAIRASLHDGITLPRAYRAAGLMTDVFDGTDICTCHMYRGNAECWRGLSKNAIEGLASPKAIVPWTILLLGGHVLPYGLLVAAIAGGHVSAAVLCGIGILGLFAMRASAAHRFREPWIGTLLHPLGVLLLIAIQWTALIRYLLGQPATWKDREYSEIAPIASGDRGV